MALIKELVDDKGITTRYHRLNKVSATAKGVVDCEVYSYTDVSFREKEKERIAQNNRYEELMRLISLENEKSEEERDTKAVIEWSDEINSMERQFVDMDDRNNTTYVQTREYHFENVDITKQYSYIDLYDMLKTLDDFVGAENHYEELDD